MRVTRIDLDESEMPEQITVVMSRREAQWIAKFNGGLNGKMVDEILPGYVSEASEIYNCLTGSLFNHFWDDGVNDAIKGNDERWGA